MPRYAYGGQALIEGVLMRGRTALAVALRHPDGTIVWSTERLDQGWRARRVTRLPLVRGLVLLYDTLVTGTRWLVRSATVAAAGQLALEEAADARAAEARAADEAPEAAAAAVPAATATAAGTEPAGATAAVRGTTAVIAPPAVDPEPAPRAPVADTGLGKGFGIAVAVMLLFTMTIAIAVFFLVPLFLASITVGQFDAGFPTQLTEGFIRVALFVAYLMVIARAPDIKRVFQYHGAEHMSIHALEAGDPLVVSSARKYPTAHPRCGTEFLVVVLIVSIFAFAVVGRQTPFWMIVSRIALVPVIAAISYEVLQFGARHRRYALVRALWAPGIWVQSITTRQPTDDMIEVALVSLERALVADKQEVPAGSAMFATRPMDGMLPPDEAAYRPALDAEGELLPEPAVAAAPASADSLAAATASRVAATAAVSEPRVGSTEVSPPKGS